MKKKTALAFLLLISPLGADDSSTIVRRVNAHLAIHDTSSAVKEALSALNSDPCCGEFWNAYLLALSRTDNEKEMMSAWNAYATRYPDAYENNEIIEAMAWGVLEKAAEASCPLTRIYALLGALFSNDAKGVNILHRHLSDNNSCVRGVAVKLASHLHDAKLCDGVAELFRKEKVANVRLEAIKAVGEMKIRSTKNDLVALVGSAASTAEEKAAAIEALVAMLDTVDSAEVCRLASSDRAGLRLIACKVVALFDLENDLRYIYPLLKDTCSEVRAAAIGAFGSVGIERFGDHRVADLAAAMLEDSDPKVAIKASWVLTLRDPARGQQAFQKLLQNERQDLRILAAGALSSCGKYGLPYMRTAFEKASDPYVKMNLAIGLLGQRSCVNQACNELCKGLMNGDERWAWQETGDFRLLVPSKMSSEESALESPTAINQLVRLDILNMVALMHYDQAQEALIRCLQQRQWGVAATAAALLLTEGDDAALELVRNVLNNSQDNVRIQAALILAMWGSDPQAISLLQQAYETADRDVKEFILESFGRIAERSTLPFLVARLQEPSQMLRILAASAILETLYN